MSEFTHGAEAPLDIAEILEIAEAIALRDMKETRALQGTLADINGQEQYQLPPDVQQKILTAKTATMISQVENPSAVPNTDEIFDSLLLGGSETLRAQINEEVDGEEMSEEQISELFSGIGKVFVDEGALDPNRIAERFTRTFESSKLVAKEHGVTVAETYRDDSLCKEIYKKAYTPEEYIEEQLASLEIISEKTINAMLVKMAEVLMPEDLRDDMQEIIMEMQMDPDLQEVVRTNTEYMHDSAKQLMVSFATRIWGDDVLNSLPQEQKERLGLREKAIEIGCVAIIGASSEQEKILKAREDFVNKYFADRNWDVANPTVEQILEVRSQPEWKSPSVRRND